MDLLADKQLSRKSARHVAGKESAYAFRTPERLVADFQRDIARWNRENRNP